MHRFTDAGNRDWTIVLNLASVRRLWDLLRINLHDPSDLGRICNQERYLLLPQILAELCRAEAERRDPEAVGQPDKLLGLFDAVLNDDAVFDAAHAAFCAELADFCRGRGRTAVARYLDATPRLLAKEAAANLAQLPDVEAMEAQLDARLQTRGGLPTSGLEKSESSPTD